MEVHFTPDVQAKLEQLARDTGRPGGELVEDAVAGLFDELAYTREMLDRRYDDLESGRVQPIDGEEAFRSFMEKTAARRRQPETR
jgi:hypothetical protein